MSANLKMKSICYNACISLVIKRSNNNETYNPDNPLSIKMINSLCLKEKYQE